VQVRAPDRYWPESDRRVRWSLTALCGYTSVCSAIKRVVDLDPEVSDGAFKFGYACVAAEPPGDSWPAGRLASVWCDATSGCHMPPDQAIDPTQDPTIREYSRVEERGDSRGSKEGPTIRRKPLTANRSCGGLQTSADAMVSSRVKRAPRVGRSRPWPSRRTGGRIRCMVPAPPSQLNAAAWGPRVGCVDPPPDQGVRVVRADHFGQHPGPRTRLLPSRMESGREPRAGHGERQPRMYIRRERSPQDHSEQRADRCGAYPIVSGERVVQPPRLAFVECLAARKDRRYRDKRPAIRIHYRLRQRPWNQPKLRIQTASRRATCDVWDRPSQVSRTDHLSSSSPAFAACYRYVGLVMLRFGKRRDSGRFARVQAGRSCAQSGNDEQAAGDGHVLHEQQLHDHLLVRRRRPIAVVEDSRNQSEPC